MYGAGKLGHHDSTKPVIMFVFLAITVILALATYKRNAIWADELTLWQDAYLKAPRKTRVVNNYAAALILRDKGAVALPLVISAIETNPGYFTVWNNLPRIFDQMPPLRGYYRNGFEMVDPDGNVNPGKVTKWYSNALNNLGLAYQLQNNIPKAFDSYRKALELNPSFSLARQNAINMISAMPDRNQASGFLAQLNRIPRQ
jgi:tetratricopeptide (TPR) repeat protein